MTKQQRKALRETLEQRRDQYAAIRPLVQKTVTQEDDALIAKHGRHATDAMRRDAARVIRDAAASHMKKELREALPNAAEIERHLEALTNDPATVLRYRMRQRLPAPPAERKHEIGDMHMSANQLARIVIAESERSRAAVERTRFEQSLPRLLPAELAALAEVAVDNNDDSTLLAVHEELRSRPSPSDNPTLEINAAKITVGTLMTKRGDSAELAEEIADLQAIVGAYREAAQSEHAVRTGNELGTVAEATREIAAAIATHGPEGAAIVAAERTARRHGQAAPPRPAPFSIPITNSKQTTEGTTKPAA